MLPLTKKQKTQPILLDDPPIKISENGLKFFGGKSRIRVANGLEIRKKAYKLLHNLYQKKGYTQNSDKLLWLSIYDALPETATFVAEDDRGCTVGALTVVFDSPIGLPADELYKKEINIIRNSGEKICEFVSLGIDNGGKSSIKILAALFYCAFIHAWRRKKSTYLVITVNPRDESFYRQKIFFQRTGPERNYSKVNGAPAVLLNLSLNKINQLRHIHRIFPFYILDYSDQEEIDFAQKIENMIEPMSDKEFYSFFIEKTDIWERASQQQKNFIKTVYPPHEVNHHEVSRALAREFSKKTFPL